mgnify:CR=1 FL=1
MIAILLSTSVTAQKDTQKELQKVAQIIKELDILYPTITLYQVREESGNLKSDLAVKHNNILGFKPRSKGKKTYAKARLKNGYSGFRSKRDCLRELKLWQQEHKASNLSRQEYLRLLRKVYADGDRNYLKNYIGY